MADHNQGEPFIRNLLNSTKGKIIIQKKNNSGKWTKQGEIGIGDRGGKYTAAQLREYRFVTQVNEPVFINLSPLPHEPSDPNDPPDAQKQNFEWKDHIDGEIGHPETGGGDGDDD